METRLSIITLGGAAILLDGTPLRGFVSSKAAALLFYLAVTGRAHRREALAALLWPEAAAPQAAKNLRDVLSNLRRLLGPFLTIDRRSAGLRAGAPVDVDACRLAELVADAERDAAAAEPLLTEAVALYGGDFLAGFALSDAEPFDEWATVERERLRQLAGRALLSLAERARAAGRPEQGLIHAARLATIDPLREEAHRQLMLLHALAGDRAAALARYEALRRLLAAELGVEPDAETERLRAQIVAGEVGRIASAALPAPRPPAALGAFFGREEELARLAAMLRAPEYRLVTIGGIGGAGKTRLALELARRLAEGGAFLHGVAFVALAAVDPPGPDSEAGLGAIVTSIADALGLRLAGEEPPLAQVVAHLRERSMLLVLDNCEHLPQAADVALQLLEGAARLKVLATSRVRLGLRGEAVVELAGLPLPAGPADDPEQYGAIRLFRYVAALANPRLAWDQAEVAAAARICALVDGLPLGIELAAGMARVLPCAEIAAEIAADPAFLQGGSRDTPARHRSLRAVLDHSWRLLGPAESRALRRLSVFRDGCSRVAAERVAGARLPLLAALADNSLLQREPASARYTMLGLVQQYAAERLAEDPAEEAELHASHAAFFLGMLATLREDLRGGGQLAALEAIRADEANVRAAWRRAAAAGRADLLAAAADGMFHFCEMRSRFSEGLELFALATARCAELYAAEPTPELALAWARIMAREGWFSFLLGRQAEARALLARSLDILAGLDAPAEQAFSAAYLAAVMIQSGDYAEAERLAVKAMAVAQSCADRLGEAIAQTILGQIALATGRHDEARIHSTASLALERDLGNSWGTVFALINLGRVAQAQGDYAGAERAFSEGLAIRRSMGDLRGVSLCLLALGEVARARGDLEAAESRFREALALAREIGQRAGAAAALAGLGAVAETRADLGGAAAHFRESLAEAWAIGNLPAALNALAALAGVLARREPRRAAALAALVCAHPAASHASRDLAARIAGAGAAPAALSLAEAVAELLKEG